MPDTGLHLTVSTLAKGSMAQLREIADAADREQARVIHAELTRIANQLGRKFGFGTHRDRSELRSVA